MAEGNGNVRWQTWAALAAVALPIMASLVAFLVQVGQLSYNVSQLDASNRDLQRRVEKLDEAAAGQRIDAAKAQERLTEIETQFRASDQVRNLMHANDLRMQSMLWKKAFGQDYPIANAYYPTIARQPAE